MKKLIVFSLTMLMLAGCSNSFLDTTPLTQKTDANFYQTPADVTQALASAYFQQVSLGNNFGSMTSNNNTASSPFLVSELMSDDRFGGGGVNDPMAHAISKFRKYGEAMYEPFWANYYAGIYQVNTILKKIDQPKWDNETQKNTAEAEARFLRAYFYLDLARLFGQVPLITGTDPVNFPKAPADSIFALIGSDLKTAIEKFPSVRYDAGGVSNLGHANKWAAEGLMARAWLFYTGYYQKADMPLKEGGTITKTQVIDWIDDCVANSGHGLVSDFRNLWPYSQVDTTYTFFPSENGGATVVQYGYAHKTPDGKKLSWIGEGLENNEAVYSLHYSTYGNYNGHDGLYYSNQIDLFFGIRVQDGIPFAAGWGFGTVNPQLWDPAVWPDNDIRKRGSVINFNDLAGEGLYSGSQVFTGYTWNGGQNFHETGLYQKKYIGVNMFHANSANSATAIESYSTILYGVTQNYQLDNTQNIMIIRFSDILLMGAELGGPNAQTYLDRVRGRVGLSSVPATLDNIKNERRWELAFEGIRWFDLLRWHDVETAMAKVKNIPVMNNGSTSGFVPNATYSKDYRPETKGFLQIPLNQIQLSNGVLTQNPGWTASDNANYNND